MKLSYGINLSIMLKIIIFLRRIIAESIVERWSNGDFVDLDLGPPKPKMFLKIVGLGVGVRFWNIILRVFYQLRF